MPTDERETNTIETALISNFKAWDGDPETMIFYEAELAVDMLGGKAGDVLPCVCLHYDQSKIAVYDDITGDETVSHFVKLVLDETPEEKQTRQLRK